MQRTIPIMLIILALFASTALAQWSLQPNSARLLSEQTTPYTDVFGDTLKYDNGVIGWWFGGLTNFRLATKFTPAASFRLQRVVLAMDSSSTAPVMVYLKNDSAGYPGGTPLWTGNLFYNAPTTWQGLTVDTTNLPQFNFTAGSNFWVEVYSNGPPFEMYDAAPVNPARSKTFYAPLGGWFNSPGDHNFIRAVGEYSAPVVDVGCTKISIGSTIFTPVGLLTQVLVHVKNFGSAPASFNVTCSLFTELGGTSYSFFQALNPQFVPNLAPGGDDMELFGGVITTTPNRYRIRARTLLAGDGNPDNNARDTEAQIYTTLPPTELRFDDTLYSNAAYALTNNGWAMKFYPYGAGNYNLDQIRVMAQVATGDSAARVQVLDDNGTAGAPGTILYQTVANMVTGWNSFNVNLTNQTGSFYVAYIFEHGTHTSALRFDDYPASGQGWVKNGAAWAADPAASDWMMRATISSGATPQSLDITLTPISPPIIVPAIGGNFSFNAGLTRLLGPMTPYVVWTRIKNPDGTYTGNMLGPITINTPVGVTITRARNQSIPGTWVPGLYSYLGYVNPTFAYPAVDSSSFTFTKLADGGTGPLVWDASCTGEPFPGERSVTASIPSGLELGISPNPFNPTTDIRYQILDARHVRLRVYDTAGRLVQTLVDGWREAGSYNAAFDGSKLAAGVYLVRLHAGDFNQTRKLILVK